MSRNENICLIHRFYRTLADQDLEEYLSMFASDVELQLIGSTRS